MITLEVGRPRELSRSLEMLSVMNVRHLRIHTKTHFWYTNDGLRDLVNKMGDFQNLLFLDITGDSYPSLLDITNFLEFLRSDSCNLKVLNIQISPPFPGQYCIQDRSFMVNKILHLIHNCRSIVRAKFYYKNEEGNGNVWVSEFNAKLNSILRNRVIDDTIKNGDHSRL